MTLHRGGVRRSLFLHKKGKFTHANFPFLSINV